AESTEPLLSRQLYDTVRQFNQDSGDAVKSLQQEMLDRGLMTKSLYDEFKDTSQSDGERLMDLTSEMLKLDFVPPASDTARRAGTGIETLRRGVEQAAGSVIGDDTEALRLAQDELNNLTEQLRQEMERAAGGGTNGAGGRGSRGQQLANNNRSANTNQQ